MGRAEALIRRLDGHSIVGLDTAVFIYHLEAHPRYLPLTRALLGQIEQGKPQGVLSPVTLMEITVRPWRLGRESLARQYEVLLTTFPHMHVVNVDRHVARRAAQLRARYDLRSPDALIAATALAQGATAFVTNDRRFSRLASLLDVIRLDDFLD